MAKGDVLNARCVGRGVGLLERRGREGRAEASLSGNGSYHCGGIVGPMWGRRHLGFVRRGGGRERTENPVVRHMAIRSRPLPFFLLLFQTLH